LHSFSLIMDGNNTKDIVRKKYSAIASAPSPCSCCQPSACKSKDVMSEIGYSSEELSNVPEAALGLGCGNPTAFAQIQEGDTVIDFGCGAGIDCFLASKKTGETGRVIGIDMTPAMIDKSKEFAEKYDYSNCEFILADIEDILLPDDSADVIISNCVINLAPSKEKVFSETYRLLKPHGRLVASDMVLTRELTESQRNDPDLIAGCVGAAILRDDYLDLIKAAGFSSVKIVSENKDISKSQYQAMPVLSLRYIAEK